MTVLSGTLRDAGGNPISGSLWLELSQAGTYSPGGILVTPLLPTCFTLTNGQISGPGPGPYTVYGNDGITPAGTFYKLFAYDTSSGQVIRENVVFTGATQDLGALVFAPTQNWTPAPDSAITLGGDAVGLTNNVTVARLRGRNISASAPALNDALRWDGAAWSPSAVPGVPVTLGQGGTGATNAATARTNLGLGSIATQAASSVSITGGAISGVTVSASSVTDTGLTSGYLPKAGVGGLLGDSPVWTDGTYHVGIGTTSVPGGYRAVVEATDVGGLLVRGNDPVLSFLALQNTLSTGSRVFRLTAGINFVSHDGFSIYDTTAAATRFVIDNAGNVGIGTTSPGARVEIVAAASAVLGENIRFGRGDASRFNSIWSYSDDSGNARIDLCVHDGVTATSQATVMSLKGSGNVGIGTTSPSNKLTVSNGGASGFEIAPDITALGMTNGTYIVSYDRNVSAYRDILFDLGGLPATSVFFKAGGNVVIGGTTAGAKLDVILGAADAHGVRVQNPSGDPTITLKDSARSYSWYLQNTIHALSLYDWTASAFRMVVDTGGAVSIGPNPAASGRLLDVNGIIKATGIQLTTGASNGYVLKSDASGNASWQAGGGGMTYKGTWNANTNTPTLADGTGTAGDTYAVTVGGTQFGRTFVAGGWCIYNGSIWEPVGTSVSVTSVNGLTGAVSLSLASSAFVNQGTTTTVLHGNAAGNPSWGAVSLTADVSGTLPVGNGGTGATTAATARTNLGLGTGDSPTFLGATLSGLTSGYFPKASAGGQLVNGPLQSDGSWLYTDIPFRVAKATSPTLRLFEAGAYAWDLIGGFTTPNDFSIYQGSASQTRFYISPTGAAVIGGTTPTSGALLTVAGVATGSLWDTGGQVVNVLASGLDNTGATDVTAGLQAILNAAYDGTPSHAKVVYLPRGRYKILTHFTIPYWVTLIGDPHGGNNLLQGTVFELYESTGGATGTPAITLQDSATLMNVGLWYPNQTASPPTPYPFAIYLGGYCTVDSVHLGNAYQGIDSATGTGFNVFHGANRIRNVSGMPLSVGIDIDQSYDVTRVENVHFFPHYATWASWVEANGTGMKIGRSDWQHLRDYFQYGYNTGIKFYYSQRNANSTLWGGASGHLYNLGFDKTNVGIDLDCSQFAGVFVDGMSYASNSAAGSQYAVWGRFTSGTVGTTGYLHVRGLNVHGTVNTAVNWGAAGVVSIRDSYFMQWGTGGNTGYAVNIANGRAFVQHNYFADNFTGNPSYPNSPNGIYCQASVDRAVVTDNMMVGKALTFACATYVNDGNTV